MQKKRSITKKVSKATRSNKRVRSTTVITRTTEQGHILRVRLPGKRRPGLSARSLLLIEQFNQRWHQ